MEFYKILCLFILINHKRNSVLNNLDYKIYTDGACLRNPGPGGWAVLIISTNQSEEKNLVVNL